MIELSWGAITDPGTRRTRNEDSLLAAPTLFVVADGMGGHAAGDVASELAVAAMSTVGELGTFSRHEVMAAVHRADADIVARAGGSAQGMGTTICGLAVVGTLEGDDERFVIFNVGDSRAYRMREQHLVQLTHDHSMVQGLVDAGQITPEQALTHPDRNVITRSLGSGIPLEIDWSIEAPVVGDRYLVTSDGLTKELTDQEVAGHLAVDRPPQEVAEGLVAAAVAAGGRDNITVLVIDVEAVRLSDLGAVDPLDAATNPGAVNRFDATTVPPGAR